MVLKQKKTVSVIAMIFDYSFTRVFMNSYTTANSMATQFSRLVFGKRNTVEAI